MLVPEILCCSMKYKTHLGVIKLMSGEVKNDLIRQSSFPVPYITNMEWLTQQVFPFLFFATSKIRIGETCLTSPCSSVWACDTYSQWHTSAFAGSFWEMPRFSCKKVNVLPTSPLQLPPVLTSGAIQRYHKNHIANEVCEKCGGRGRESQTPATYQSTLSCNFLLITPK